MKDYKEYFKSKSVGVKGFATLQPPAGGDALQSVASMTVLDLVSEGPIYGLVDSQGRKANNISILESLYLNNTAVLDTSVSTPQIRTVDFDQIQMMGRLTSGNIDQAFSNISGQLVAHQSATAIGQAGNRNNPPLYAPKFRAMGQDRRALLEFVDENPSLSRFGMMQFKLSGIFPTGDAIYSRINNTSNTFTIDPDLNPDTVTDFIVEWSNGTDSFTGTATIDTNSTPNGSKKWNVAYTNSAGAAATTTIFKQSTNPSNPDNGEFFWQFGTLRSYANNSTNGNNILLAIINHFSPQTTSTTVDFPWTDRTSSIWYEGQGAGSLPEWTVKFNTFSDTNLEIYNATVFNLDVYNGNDKASRLVENKDGEAIEVPSPIVYGGQFFNNLIFSDYAASPAVVAVNQAGKVGNQYLIDGFAGGGIYFFEIGDNDELKANGDFDTGKFFVVKGGNVPDTLQSGLDNGYDVFVYDSATGPISLESPSPNQLSPIVGELAGQNIGLGYTSDLDLRYNYGNIDFDFRDGFETQPKMEGHSEGAQDFQIQKKLYGPLTYGGSATAGDGQGYADDREGGDFSNWMINLPLESDAYSYTHTIRRMDVKKCTPTLSIEGLSDTIDEGGNGVNAGVQKAETLLIGYTYGFEGGITEAVGASLSGGNTLQDLALGTFQIDETVRYSGIIVSNYLDTYSGISDLPRNKSLKNLKVDDDSIPGLTQAFIDEFGYTSGDLLFPGEDWKVPNRFLKIEKLSFETDSVLISRECSMSYVSETIGEPFSYPLVAAAGTIVDARNFASQPTRDFEVRGKLVAIPSNYEPLNADGSDKRFISNSKDYGLRSIQTFDGSTNAKVYEHIDLGTNNFEIEARVGFGSVSTTSTDYQYIVDMDGGILQANRVAIFQNDNKIKATITKSNSTTEEFTLEVSILGRSITDVYDISLKGIGQKYTLEVKVGDTVVGTDSDTMDTPRGNINFGGTTTNQGANSAPFLLIGINGSETTATRLKTGTKLSDLRIRKNNQLIHHWDGTVIDTVRHDNCIKDRVGGFHADITPNANANAVLDSNFTFGKNRKRIYNGAWDGTFKLGWTDNPAWILYDLMINPIYGVGNAIDDREDINIFNLYQIARYCDAVDDDGYFDGLPDSTKGLEPRFSCNLRIYDSKNAFEVLGNIASIFRGFTYWDGIGLNFAVDNEKEVSAIFNNGNVFDGVFTYGDITSSARFTKVEIMYADAIDQYATKVEYIEDEDGIRKYGIISKILNGIGCTSKSQAKRLGKYVLLSNKMETEIVQFQAASECFFLEPGDIIRIDDEVKNFEINYGKVLEVNSTTPDPYVEVESVMNTNNIQLGSNGGVYLYTNRKQNELENIYDIVKFQTAYQFGKDSDLYNGVVNSDFIEEQTLTEIQKIQITGTLSGENSIKLYLDAGDSNFSHITGVQSGSFFNVELNNEVDKTYKVVKKTQQEGNLFSIDAMQYDINKFRKIEEEDFDVEEITYNIGIPAHTINRPLSPTYTEFQVQNNDLTYSATGTITAASNSNETSYRVIAYRSNQSGPYIQKEFQRESDNTTDYELNGLIDGFYTIQVAALRNPESSDNVTKTFYIGPKRDVYMAPMIKKIEISNSSNSNYERVSGSGLGSGSSNYQDIEYSLVTVDKKDRIFSLTKLDYTLDVFVERNGEYITVEEDYEDDIFRFDEVDNLIIFGSYNSEFTMKFDLKKDGTVIDSAFFETTVN